MPQRIKICGVATTQDTVHAVQLGAWAVGFNCFPASPRYRTPEVFSALTKMVPEAILKVGVFVDASLKTLKDTVQLCNFDLVQLHGYEALGYCEQSPVPVIKAFRIKNPQSIPSIKRYLAQVPLQSKIKYLLLDCHHPHLFGGTGESFDWSLIREIQAVTALPIILAGGLNPINIAQAMTTTRVYAYDVCSGIELLPGTKDPELMNKLFLNAQPVVTDPPISFNHLP